MYSLDWAYAYGKPQATADFKLAPADFQVTEFFSAPFSGEGEHIVLQIEKKGLTTEEVVKSLSRLTHRSIKLISYAGLKDKHALTTQWISIHAPGEVIEGVEHLEAPGWRVLAATRHNKKLKPGFLAGNKFVLTLRNVSDEADLSARIEQVKRSGVPNYFGEQRFGRELNNLVRAEELLVHGRKVKDKFLKGMYFSAARSWLYNLILSQRVAAANWNQPLAGDVMQLSGCHSIFSAAEGDASLLSRIKDKDISPASPLAGKTKNMVQGEAQALIQQVYEQWPLWLAGLNQFGLEEAWRANILYVNEFDYSFNEGNAQLSFTLPPGTYATAVLRELVVY